MCVCVCVCVQLPSVAWLVTAGPAGWPWCSVGSSPPVGSSSAPSAPVWNSSTSAWESWQVDTHKKCPHFIKMAKELSTFWYIQRHLVATKHFDCSSQSSGGCNKSQNWIVSRFLSHRSDHFLDQQNYSCNFVNDRKTNNWKYIFLFLLPYLSSSSSALPVAMTVWISPQLNAVTQENACDSTRCATVCFKSVTEAALRYAPLKIRI